MREQIEKLVAEELARANDKFPGFASNHEAYAVLLEEVEELDEATSIITGADIKCLWDCVRDQYFQMSYFKLSKDEIIRKHLLITKANVIEAIKEAIQVAAMCDKWQQFLDKENNRG